MAIMNEIGDETTNFTRENEMTRHRGKHSIRCQGLRTDGTYVIIFSRSLRVLLSEDCSRKLRREGAVSMSLHALLEFRCFRDEDRVLSHPVLRLARQMLARRKRRLSTREEKREMRRRATVEVRCSRSLRSVTRKNHFSACP